MANITKLQKVIILEGNIELWIDADRAEKLVNEIKQVNFDDTFDYEGRTFAKRIFKGVFLPEDIENATRRKNGQWQCKYKKWHDRGEKCVCIDPKEKIKREEYKQKFYQEHGYYPPI